MKEKSIVDVIVAPVKCYNCIGKGKMVVKSVCGTNKDELINCPICEGKGEIDETEEK